jgi:hypothetical protein
MADGVSIRHTKTMKDKLETAQKILGLANKYYDAFVVSTFADIRFILFGAA